jgi:D-arabinose 1-dehydrogenase-like Zn-dependent alcohol dehydrogenase
MFGRKSVCGSACGSIAETEECLEFCVRHDIKPAVRIITGDDLDHVYKTLADKNDSVVRYVLDVKNTLTNPN